MRARIFQLATPRRMVATEWAIGALCAVVALALFGPTPVSLGLVAICVLTMMPALIAIDRMEKRRSR